ncbi:DUF4368 domain-containing protein [Clostridium phoceensis]|uniref:DUF4368 domain-containing protein n=1 Tax=Clostridium phoceensis TaxID=1650661 RepID=UPI0011CA7AFC|nr:DUF4368 domain-containing protein [Clostridium phoceensis]
MYKDSVLGSLPAGSSSPLAGSYTAEQEALKADILWREAGIQALREKVSDTDSFIARAKRYTDITELTLEQYRSPDMMEFY